MLFLVKTVENWKESLQELFCGYCCWRLTTRYERSDDVNKHLKHGYKLGTIVG